MSQILEMKFGVGALGTRTIKNSGGDLYHLQLWVGSCSGLCSQKAPVYAIEFGLTGNHAGENGVWDSKDTPILTSDVPTPLFYDGSFFILSDLRKTISSEAQSGKVEWSCNYLVNINGGLQPLAMGKSTQ